MPGWWLGGGGTWVLCPHPDAGVSAGDPGQPAGYECGFGVAQPGHRVSEGVVQRGLGGQPQGDRPEQRVPAGGEFGLAERGFRCGGIADGGRGGGVILRSVTARPVTPPPR
jgi:hypothetical protein